MKNKYKNISAFTLAEVLITIVIISLLALITLPILKGGVDNKVTDSQKKTFEQKLKENFHAMQSAGALSEGYDSTEDFINAMKKHMNISRTCSSNKLSECFAEKVITEEKEVKYNTKQMSTSDDISAGFSENSDLGGVVFADGTTAIIAHDSNCYIKDKYDSSIDATACIAMIYDINGKNAPNILGVDVFKLNTSDFGLSFVIINNTKYSPGVTVNGVTWTSVDNSTNGGYSRDYWLGAKRFCKAIGGNLPEKSQLNEIAGKLYSCKPKGSFNTYSCQPDTANRLWPIVERTYLWANDSIDNMYAYNKVFLENGANDDFNYRAIDSYNAICVR